MNIIDTTTPIEWVGSKAFIGDKLVAVTAQTYTGLRLGVWYRDGQERMHWLDARTADLDDIRARGMLEVIPDHADLNP